MNNPKIEIHKCTCRDLINHVEKESIDLILTDPPYPKEFLHCYRELAEFAVHALRPGASLLAMSGHAWMPELLQLMQIEGLKYNWMIHFGPFTTNTHSLGRHVSMVRWKPFLWYCKPPIDKDVYIMDTIQGGWN